MHNDHYFEHNNILRMEQAKLKKREREDGNARHALEYSNGIGQGRKSHLSSDEWDSGVIHGQSYEKPPKDSYPQGKAKKMSYKTKDSFYDFNIKYKEDSIGGSRNLMDDPVDIAARELELGSLSNFQSRAQLQRSNCSGYNSSGGGYSPTERPARAGGFMSSLSTGAADSGMYGHGGQGNPHMHSQGYTSSGERNGAKSFRGRGRAGRRQNRGMYNSSNLFPPSSFSDFPPPLPAVPLPLSSPGFRGMGSSGSGGPNFYGSGLGPPAFEAFGTPADFLGEGPHVALDVTLLKGPEGLCMDITAWGKYVRVVGFRLDSSGRVGPAEASGLLQVGDLITEINGVDLTNHTFQTACQLLGRPPKHLHLVFHRNIVETSRGCVTGVHRVSTSMAVPEGGGLGLELRPWGDLTLVAGFVTKAGGQRGLAESLGAILPGDLLVSINGVEVGAIPFNATLQLLGRKTTEIHMKIVRQATLDEPPMLSQPLPAPSLHHHPELHPYQRQSTKMRWHCTYPSCDAEATHCFEGSSLPVMCAHHRAQNMVEAAPPEVTGQDPPLAPLASPIFPPLTQGQHASLPTEHASHNSEEVDVEGEDDDEEQEENDPSEGSGARRMDDRLSMKTEQFHPEDNSMEDEAPVEEGAEEFQSSTEENGRPHASTGIGGMQFGPGGHKKENESPRLTPAQISMLQSMPQIQQFLAQMMPQLPNINSKTNTGDQGDKEDEQLSPKTSVKIKSESFHFEEDGSEAEGRDRHHAEEERGMRGELFPSQNEDRQESSLVSLQLIEATEHTQEHATQFTGNSCQLQGSKPSIT